MRKADEPTRQRYRKIADGHRPPDRDAGRLPVAGAHGRARAPAPGRQRVAPRLLLEEVVAQARVAGRQVSSTRGRPAGAAARRAGRPAPGAEGPAGQCAALHAGRQRARTCRDGARTAASSWRCATTAPGVPPADLPHIFDKGYRGSNAAGLPGSGLGLYMARSVVEVHGGTLAHAAPPRAAPNSACGCRHRMRREKVLPQARPAVIIGLATTGVALADAENHGK